MNFPSLLQRSPKEQEQDERVGNLGYQAHGVAVVGTPSTMILQEATTLRSDLILMGTRGRQGITRFVLGSVSHKVLCWVLAFH
jgi:nucleotide-binding universal stress UspA family protein